MEINRKTLLEKTNSPNQSKLIQSNPVQSSTLGFCGQRTGRVSLAVLQWLCVSLAVLQWLCVSLAVLQWLCVSLAVLQWLCVSLAVLQWLCAARASCTSCRGVNRKLWRYLFKLWFYNSKKQIFLLSGEKKTHRKLEPSNMIKI